MFTHESLHVSLHNKENVRVQKLRCFAKMVCFVFDSTLLNGYIVISSKHAATLVSV